MTLKILIILIPIAIFFTIIAIYFFHWAIKQKQYEDLEKETFNIFNEGSPNLHTKNKEND